MKKTILLSIALATMTTGKAQTLSYDFSKKSLPTFFSVDVPDGNYRVTVELGSKKKAAKTMVRAENRRLMVEETATAKGKTKTFTFAVNKRTPEYTYTDKEGEHKGTVKIKERERDYFTWDDKLTLEFTGEAPAVKSLRIERDSTARQLFLCGNSTVVDQFSEPFTSWGQMITRWFTPDLVVCNHAESGLTARTFLGSNRLDKILSQLREGDYVVCEFGHNDEKEHRPGDGAWYHYAYMLKTYIDRVREKGGNIIFCTPTQRRRFDEATKTKIENTHGDFPAAMKAVAEREGVPVIDLNATTKTFFETLGYEDSKKALVHYPLGTFANQKRELADNTHFNPYGAYEIAKMVVEGLKAINSPLTQYLKDDWAGFTPSEPDPFDVLKWTPSTITDTTKPDGN